MAARRWIREGGLNWRTRIKDEMEEGKTKETREMRGITAENVIIARFRRFAFELHTMNMFFP